MENVIALRWWSLNALTGPLLVLHRADLVPVYSFGENELFQQVIFSEGSLARKLQDLFKKVMGFAPCLFIGERMALVPYKIPLTIVGRNARHSSCSISCLAC